MSRTVAVIWHALFSIAAGVLYFLFVLPRWWELSGDTSHTLGTVLRIVAGALIGLAALPVVFTWLRTRRPEFGTPQLALRLRLSSIVLHVLGGILIVGTAISEIWLTLDEAGRWLFGIYGAAAAISLLGVFSFYLAFIAELPPPSPRPLKKRERTRRWRRRTEKNEEAEEPITVETANDVDEAEESGEAQGGDVAEEAETMEAETETGAETGIEADETSDDETDGDTTAPDDTLAAESGRGGLRNRRPTDKPRRPRLRRKSGGVTVED